MSSRSWPIWKKSAAAGAFDEVVIVAPPVALGEMRKAVSGALTGKIVAWVDKDLTKHTIPEMTGIIATALGA